MPEGLVGQPSDYITVTEPCSTTVDRRPASLHLDPRTQARFPCVVRSRMKKIGGRSTGHL